MCEVGCSATAGAGVGFHRVRSTIIPDTDSRRGEGGATPTGGNTDFASLYESVDGGVVDPLVDAQCRCRRQLSKATLSELSNFQHVRVIPVCVLHAVLSEGCDCAVHARMQPQIMTHTESGYWALAFDLSSAATSTSRPVSWCGVTSSSCMWWHLWRNGSS